MEEFRCWTWLWSWLWTLFGLNEVNGARDWRDSLFWVADAAGWGRDGLERFAVNATLGGWGGMVML